MENNRPPIYINITSLTIVKIILILILFYFLYLIKDILIILFISLILASALDPWVDWQQRRKIPRGVGIILIYLVLLMLFVLAMLLVIPPIIEQAKELSISYPTILQKIISTFSAFREFSIQHGIFDNLKEYFSTYSSNFSQAASGIFSTVTSFVGGIFSFFLVLVITFYMTVEENAMKKIVVSISPEKYQVYIMHLINRMQSKVGLWLRGQLIQSLIIFSLVYIGLLILGVKYALILALIAGITEFIPYIGATLAAIPAIFLAFVQSPILAVFVAILYYIVQLIEHNIVVPKVMQKVVGLNPIVSIAVLLVGFKLAGPVGALLSIPVATAISVFILDIFDSKLLEKETPPV